MPIAPADNPLHGDTIMLSPFGATSTTDDVLDGLDLSGMRVLVTGVSAGLGVETARALAAHGAKVIGTVRDLAKGRRSTGGSIELIELDLASLASVRAAADALLEQGDAFDLVIANAGVMATPFGKTRDGFETQFGTNHLGHFVLVNRLAPLLKAGARVVMLSSAGHRESDVDLDDPNFERTPYTPFAAYGRSKTANILFAVEFDRRHKAEGVRAAAVHPGGIRTELARHMEAGALDRRLEQVNQVARAEGRPEFTWKTVAQGAATTLWAGVRAGADEVGGRYCEDCHVAEPVAAGSKAPGGIRPYALDPERAKALWRLSEEMVGESFPVTP
jgi:NAD(P)-dependent dehydrogenase (short-subunit alcohol dehydrogenase family)